MSVISTLIYARPMDTSLFSSLPLCFLPLAHCQRMLFTMWQAIVLTEYPSRGMSASMSMLMVARFFTGVGGSGLVDVISILLNGRCYLESCQGQFSDQAADLVSPSRVAVLRSYLAVAATLGISSGGPIGGLLTQTVGWRW